MVPSCFSETMRLWVTVMTPTVAKSAQARKHLHDLGEIPGARKSDLGP
jgi:hypothetical protein